MLLFTMSFYLSYHHKKQSTLWAEFIINSNECEPIFQVLFLRILIFFFLLFVLAYCLLYLIRSSLAVTPEMQPVESQE